MQHRAIFAYVPVRISRGELVAGLDDWLPPFAGFFLYFPSRHTVTPKLRALIDHVRRFRDQAS